jgi:hypothetical protein
MTSKRLLEVIDPETLNERLAAFFTRWQAQQRCAQQASRLPTAGGHLEHAQLAIDGKTVRATSQEAQPVHLSRAYDVKTGVVLFQVKVQDKQKEISGLKPRLSPGVHQRTDLHPACPAHEAPCLCRTEKMMKMR